MLSGPSRALWLAAAALSTVACYSTEPFYAAKAEPGRTGFGFAENTFSLLAPTSVWSAAQAAALDADGGNDSVWRLYEGARFLQFCQQAGTVASCMEAVFVDEGEPELGMGIMMIMVDPLNRGSYALEQTTTHVDGSTTQSTSGAVFISDWDLPVVPGRGVWLTTSEQPCTLFGAGAPLFHCQLEGGRPICRTTKIAGDRADICGLAGVHVVGTQDVAWIYDTDHVYRCVAHQAQPEPICQQARQVGPGPAPPPATMAIPAERLPAVAAPPVQPTPAADGPAAPHTTAPVPTPSSEPPPTPSPEPPPTPTGTTPSPPPPPPPPATSAQQLPSQQRR